MQSKIPHSRSVILGAGGFIGINLAKSLAAKDCELICFDRIQCPHLPDKAQIITGDLAAMPPELLANLNDATVYHLVSSCRASPSTENAANELIADVATTLRYLEETRGKNIRWIFISSGGTVYGPGANCPTLEGSPTDPICSYGLVKLTLEKYFALYKKLHGTDFVVARISNPYGPWQDPLRGQGVIPALIYKALAGQIIEIWGDGENVRDFLFIDDVIDGLLDLARYGESGSIYNVSSGEGATINELIKIVSISLNTHLSTKYVSARKSDVRKSILASKKLQRLAGWQSKVCLEEGIKKTSDWISLEYLQ